eukprot:SAG22_NODE_344_length_11914_cov_6.665679_1_plen_182_part_00
MACCGSRPAKKPDRKPSLSPGAGLPTARPPAAPAAGSRTVLTAPVDMVVVAAEVAYPDPKGGGSGVPTQIRQMPSRFARPVPLAPPPAEKAAVMDAKGVAAAMMSAQAAAPLPAPGTVPVVEQYTVGKVLSVLEQVTDLPNRVGWSRVQDEDGHVGWLLHASLGPRPAALRSVSDAALVFE